VKLRVPSSALEKKKKSGGRFPLKHSEFEGPSEDSKQASIYGIWLWGIEGTLGVVLSTNTLLSPGSSAGEVAMAEHTVSQRLHRHSLQMSHCFKQAASETLRNFTEEPEFLLL
jgi:hypothetical protein